ncbi:MAG: response regulator [Magnetococcales bacterium]|nr:response regulator [Magnetococcales bacterium]
METSPGPKETILVVDDEPANIELLHEVLQDNYHVLFATNGRQALEIATRQIPDLILLDIMMPEMNGTQVCIELSLDAKTREIPVIFVTALSGAEEETAALEIGAADYITKPVNAGIVMIRVRNQLEIKQCRERSERLYRAYQALLEHTGEMILMLNRQGEIRELNPAAQSGLILDPPQVIGDNWNGLFSQADEGARVIQEIQSQGCFVGEVSLKQSDGTILPVQLSCYTQMDPEGEEELIVCHGKACPA